MRAGVRPGLQILRVCLWLTGRFDSDTLPPDLPFPGNHYPMARKGRAKAFDVTKEVKRRARKAIGTPPPARVDTSSKTKQPKHKKKVWISDLEP